MDRLHVSAGLAAKVVCRSLVELGRNLPLHHCYVRLRYIAGLMTKITLNSSLDNAQTDHNSLQLCFKFGRALNQWRSHYTRIQTNYFQR